MWRQPRGVQQFADPSVDVDLVAAGGGGDNALAIMILSTGNLVFTNAESADQTITPPANVWIWGSFKAIKAATNVAFIAMW